MNLRRAIPLQLGRLTGALPPSLDAKIWRFLRLRKKIPLWRLRGEANDGSASTMISGGEDPRAEYLPALFFKGDFECEPLGSFSSARMPATLRREMQSNALTAVRLDRWVIRKRFSRDYFLVPEWVRSSMPVPENFEKLSHEHNSVRQDLRLVRKNQFSSRESHSDDDFNRFFDTMYRPHGLVRHGPAAHLKSKKSIHYLFKRGSLIWIIQGAQEIAGVVMQMDKKVGNFWAIGVLGGDPQYLKSGALAACYYFGLDAARLRQCVKLDLGGTRPSIKDGLFRYKQKWGAVIEKHPVHVNDHVFGWRAATPAILAMLEKTPLLFREHSGLSGLIARAEGKTPSELPPGVRKLVEVRPGISSRELLQAV